MRPTVVVWTVVVFLVVVAGLTILLGRAFGMGGDHSATTAPQVTVTASPDQGSDPITAQENPEVDVTDDPPTVVVGPGIDLSQYSFDDPTSPWVVVNKTRPLDPPSWAPPELASAGVTEMVPQAAAALEEMFVDAAAEDIQLRTATGYRGYGFQQTIFRDYVAEFGQERAERFSARPGHSEHQTGWAVDVFSSERCRIKACFADEPAGLWVADNAHRYGFVIRYPQGAEDVTGYLFEPWHIRYVGPELATAMHERGIATLEQALGLPAAPDYPAG